MIALSCQHPPAAVPGPVSPLNAPLLSAFGGKSPGGDKERELRWAPRQLLHVVSTCGSVMCIQEVAQTVSVQPNDFLQTAWTHLVTGTLGAPRSGHGLP